MPRHMNNWTGKAAPPEARAQLPPAVSQGSPPAEAETGAARTKCPRCGEGELTALASGALGCRACAAIFSEQSAETVRIEQPPETALNQIEQIDAMLRRNALVLGPGGIPLAADSAQTARGERRRNQRRRN